MTADGRCSKRASLYENGGNPSKREAASMLGEVQTRHHISRDTRVSYARPHTHAIGAVKITDYDRVSLTSSSFQRSITGCPSVREWVPAGC